MDRDALLKEWLDYESTDEDDIECFPDPIESEDEDDDIENDEDVPERPRRSGPPKQRLPSPERPRRPLSAEKATQQKDTLILSTVSIKKDLKGLFVLLSTLRSNMFDTNIIKDMIRF